MTKGDIALDLDKFVVRSEEFIYGNVYNSKHIAFTVTENYVCYAGIVLTSILENSLGEYSFHIFSTNYYKNDMEKMRKTEKINLLFSFYDGMPYFKTFLPYIP